MLLRSVTRSLAAPVLLMGGSACSIEDDTVVTDADRAVVGLLLPHHHLGMLLIDEATVRSDDVRLRRLVFEMGSYHTAEIEVLERLSDVWEVPPADSFPGDLTSAQLSELAADDDGHDIRWLQLMIDHHEGALDIVTTYLSDVDTARAHDDVESIASSVHLVQHAELDAMRRLLDELCASVADSRACDQ